MLLGINWMDPEWLLDQFGAAFLWVSLAIVFVECGLLFPFLPGDTLLFALGPVHRHRADRRLPRQRRCRAGARAACC